MKVLDSSARLKVTEPVPQGLILIFSGTTLPAGYALCDGTLGTPDLTDRFIVGDTAIGLGTAGGTVSATAALTHTGAAIGNHSNHGGNIPSHTDHVVVQAGSHSNHVVTQAVAHATHAAGGAHTHDAHASDTLTASGNARMTGPVTHVTNPTHTHDAHVVHAGAAVDAHTAHSAAALDSSTHTGTALDAHSVHSVTQSSDHSITKYYKLAFIMKR